MQIDEASDMEASDMEAVAVGNTGKFGGSLGWNLFLPVITQSRAWIHSAYWATGALGNQTFHSDIFEV